MRDRRRWSQPTRRVGKRWGKRQPRQVSGRRTLRDLEEENRTVGERLWTARLAAASREPGDGDE